MLVSNFYPPFVVGGAEVVASHLAAWLVSAGHNVTVVSTCSPGEDETDVVTDGVRVLRFFPHNLWWNYDRFASGDKRSPRAKLSWNLRDAWNFDAALRFGRILDAVRPEVVHTHNIKGFSPIIWREAGRRGLPVVHTTHDYHLLCRGGVMLRPDSSSCVTRCLPCRLHGRWYSACSRRIDVLCSPSAFVLGRHAAVGVVGRLGSLVVPNGVPSSRTRDRAGSSGQTFRLLYVGQLRREKGAHLLPQIMASIGGDVTLDVAGTGDLAPMLAEAARVDQRIRLHGFVTGLSKSALFDEADALLFPSTWTENAPLAIAEASMSGLPVVASDLGAIPEFVFHGRDGLLVASGDHAGFAAAVQDLRHTPGLLERLSSGAAARATGRTVSAMGAAYLQAYALAVGGRSVTP